MEHPRVKGVLHTVVIASVGLLLAASIPLARDALTEPLTIGIAAATVPTHGRQCANRATTRAAPTASRAI
jgi:hypothetical protein